MSSSTQISGLMPHVEAAVPTEPVWRLSVAQFHQMLAAGILTEDDPLEFLDGWLVPKMMKNPVHPVVTDLVRESLQAVMPAGWFLRCQDPITLATSEPEPDVAVVRGQLRDYLQRHPGPEEVALVVEVADTSLPRDQTTKKQIYARAGIAEYWVVNLLESRIEVYSSPSSPDQPPDYQQRHDFAAADVIPVVIDGTRMGEIQVQRVLP
jgi:Uma2 family endonuclease